ncbi:MAG: hypothetical protein NVSMB33_12560 [Ktedonobacteraceae bacterium]
MEKTAPASADFPNNDTLFQIVGDISDFHQALPDQQENVLMGPMAQITLFGYEVKQPISVKELNQAYKVLAKDIAESLALTHSDQISFFCVNDRRIPRWHQFAHVMHNNGTEGFLKIGRSEEAKEALKYEIRNFEVARAINYPPTVKLITSYTETSRGLGFFDAEWVDSRDGYTASNSLFARSMLPAEYGRIAAKISIPRSGTLIPSRFDTSCLRLAESGIESPEIFLKALHREQKILLSPRYREEVEQLVGTDLLKELFEEVDKYLPTILQESEEEDRTYFCINDWGTHTACFCNNAGEKRFRAPLVVYFLGFAGKAYNKRLANLYDWGNFWAHCCPNISMQQAFLEKALQLDPLQSLDKTYKFFRSIIIARTVFIAYVLMDKNHPRHDIAASLLRNLLPNLQQLEERYRRIRS